MKKPVKQKNRRIRQSQRRSAAEEGIKGNMQLHEVRPHLDFLNRSLGSLPETITEGDLATLNSGLGFLFARLREARQQHDKDEDGGRVADAQPEDGEGNPGQRRKASEEVHDRQKGVARSGRMSKH